MDTLMPVPLDETHAAGSGTTVCPYLVSAAGPWRSAAPARDHRCSRLGHDARLDLDHQRRYCVGSGGPGCQHYVIARAPGRLSSMLPVVLDRGPLGATLEQDRLRRLAAPATVVIVGAALGAYLLARGPSAPGLASGGGPGGPTAGPSSSPAASAPASLPATAAPSATPGLTPSTPPSAAPRASAAPSPAVVRTYTVRSGDTLGGIAAKFGTTSRALAKLNGIANPSLIRPGQVLRLP